MFYVFTEQQFFLGREIMNKKIAKTLLILCITYMLGYYILKFIFPEQLLLVVTDTNVISIGQFIDSNIVYRYILTALSTLITLMLFVCASSGRFKFKWYEILYVILGMIACELCAEFIPELYTHTSISIMFILATLCKGKLLSTTLSFVIHGYLSQFLFCIRGFETIIQTYTTITGIALMIECYMWLFVLALYFNIKEKKDEISTTISK